MVPNSLGKKNCFNCGMDNHWVVNCPNLPQSQRDKLAGTANITIGALATQIIQNSNNLSPVGKESNATGFLQNKSRNPHVAETRKTLNFQRLYLNSTSSFHQVFTKEHLDNLRSTGPTLQANCNAGTTYATNKGWYCNLFNLWHVRNGIANLLSLPQLEADGFTARYHTGGNWIVNTPQGKEITFHQEKD
jgi:hypothetical protein